MFMLGGAVNKDFIQEKNDFVTKLAEYVLCNNAENWNCSDHLNRQLNDLIKDILSDTMTLAGNILTIQLKKKS